jgi:hypothetical protein
VLRRCVRSRNIKNRCSIYIYDISNLRVNQLSDRQLFNILSVRASYYMVMRLCVHGLFCSNVPIYVSQHTYFLHSFKVAVCMTVNMKLEMENTSSSEALA